VLKRSWFVGLFLALAAGLGLFLYTASPPGLLSKYDAAMGGGKGVRQVAHAVPFGEHGQTLNIWRATDHSNAARQKPVLIFWHGGGWVKGSADDYDFAARAFANEGFVVVVANYRKVPGVLFPAFVEDGADAVRWTVDNIARFGGDPDNIAFAGHSAGAHTAVLLALDPYWLRAKGVDREVLRAAIGLSGPYDFYPFTEGRGKDAMGQYPDPARTQPITFARADAPPMLLVTSSEDVTVKPKNAINLSRRLHEMGAPVKLINYAGLDHEDVVMALSKPFRDKASVLADSVGFLEKHMQDKGN
jgi:acetyl esterase/lipase